MKFKGAIIWLVFFIAACAAMHHVCASMRIQLNQSAAQHQRALEEATDVR